MQNILVVCIVKDKYNLFLVACRYEKEKTVFGSLPRTQFLMVSY